MFNASRHLTFFYQMKIPAGIHQRNTNNDLQIGFIFFKKPKENFSIKSIFSCWSFSTLFVF